MNFIKNFFSKQQLTKSTLMMSVAGFVGIAISLGIMLFADAVAPTPSQNGGILNGATDVPISTFVATRFDGGPLDIATISTSTVILQANTGNIQGGVPTGQNFCLNAMLVESSSTIVCDHMSDQIPLATSTWYTFTIASSTSNMVPEQLASDVVTVFQTGNFDSNNNITPPFVQSSVPQSGESSFPTNGNLLVTFPAGDQGNMSTSGQGSVTSTSNIMVKTVTNGQPSNTNICEGGCTFTWNNNNHTLKVDPTSELSANTDYVLIIGKNITNVANVKLQGGMQDVMQFFHTASGADNSSPTIVGMNPADSATDVQLNLSAVIIHFSKDMDQSTINTTTVEYFEDTDGNSSKNGGEASFANFGLKYDSMQKTLFVGYPQLLSTNTKYCVRFVDSGVTDSLGNALTSGSDLYKCFTTTAQAYSPVAPTVQSVDADNFMAWVQYDQPVSSTMAMDKTNYALVCGTNQLNTSGMNLVYRPEANAVEIQNHGCSVGSILSVTVTNVTDVSGTSPIVANNNGQVTVLDSNTTGGIIGSFDKPDFNNTDFGNFWENPTRCAPNTMIAGKTSRWMCEFSVPVALTTGAKFIITIPSGFDISNATIPAGTNSFLNADLNGPGPGVTTISAITNSTVANTITLTLNQSGSAMNSNDHIRFELEGIVNTLVAGSNSASIVVKDSSDVKQGQTINTAPFTIGEGGSSTISGTVCKGSTSGGACGGGDTGLSGVKVFIDSPQSGHQEVSTDGSGAYSFTNLSDGQYNIGIFVDPSQGALGGGNNFQSVTLSNGANALGVDFKKADMVATGGLALTFNITAGPASTALDIFCFAPNSSGFSSPVMKSLTTNGSGAVSDTLTLQPNTSYQCGLGPHIPFDSFSSGGPPSVPDFTFMPPAPKMINVTTTPLSTDFVLITTTNEIHGKVTDGSGTAIANVFVDARPVGCFDNSTGDLKDCNGAFAKSKSDGTFVLSVTEGTYILSACAPGMPCSKETEVTVKADTSNVGTDNNSTADVYSKGTLLTGQGQLIKMSKSDLTIAGQVQDENGTAIQYAFVHAQRGTGGSCSSFTPNGGDTGSPTDAQGNYTLYVSAGTWRVEAFAGSYGQVNCSIVTVGSSSVTGQNIKATTADYGTISGTVTKAGSPVQGANVNCFGPAGGNQTMTGSDGSYSMKLKAGNNYSCNGFIPGSGPLAPTASFTLASSGTATKNLVMASNPGTISIDLGSTITNAFCDAKNSSGVGNGTGQNNNGVYTINVPADTYTVRCGNPDLGEVGTTSTVVIANTINNITFSAPTLYQVTGRITDGTDNLQGASITLTDKSNGRIVFKQSDAKSGSNANVTLSVPAGTYSVMASKSGYVDSSSPETLVVSSAGSFATRSLIKASAAVAVTVQSSSSNYTGSAKVVATKSDGKIVTADVDKTATSGTNASLLLTDGTWSVRSFADNGKTVVTASTIVVTNNTPDNNTLALDLSQDISGFSVSQPQQQSMIPANGGLFKDSNINNFELNIPTGALSTSDATAGTIETKTNPTLAISTPGKEFVGTSAIDITPTNSSGQKISDISSAATIVMPFDPTAIPSGVATSSLKCGSWDEAAGEWEMLPSSVDTTNNTITCQTTHFSTFGVLAATSGGTDSNSNDSTPAPSSSGGGGGSSFVTPIVPTKSEAVKAIKLEATYEINKPTLLELGSETHTVTVLSANASSTTVLIESTPVTSILSINEAQNIDTNADGFNDLSVTYTGLNDLGNVKLEVVTLTDSIETQGPLSINAGQYETNTTTVTLFLNATNVSQVMFSNVSNFVGGKYVPYSVTSSWNLTEGNGAKTVYVRFKSSTGSTVDNSDSIELIGQGFEQKIEMPLTNIFCPLSIGKAYKYLDSRAVYYITSPFVQGDKCTKRAFKKSDVFFSYFDSWQDVNIVDKSTLWDISEDSLGFMPWGPKFNPQYGALIKAVTDPKVYLLIEGKKRWIDSEEAFMNLGYSWNWVEDVDQKLLDSVAMGDDINKDSGYPSGLLIKYSGNSDIYLLVSDDLHPGKLLKRHVKDMASFNTLGYRLDRIVVIPVTTQFDNGDELAGDDKNTSDKFSLYNFTLNLIPGSSGTEVKKLQIKLQDLGYLSEDIESTGYYGPATTEAIKALQKAKGIEMLGIVGPSTRKVLNSL